MIIINEMEKQSTSLSVTFNIGMDDEVRRKEPRRIKLMKKKHNEKKRPTADEIEQKQKLAHARRQERIKNRLMRIQEREEATRKLVYNVEILLKQQSLKQKQLQNPHQDINLLTNQEILRTAYNVAKEFKQLKQQLVNIDLKVDEKQHKPMQQTDTKLKQAIQNDIIKPKETVDEKLQRKQQAGIYFEISCDNLKKNKSCKDTITSFKKNVVRNGKEITDVQLKEKQRKAAKSRERRLETRVRRCRESREALMKLQTKVNTYQQYEEALQDKIGSCVKLSNSEAASLANDIANGFSILHRKYEKDLKMAEDFVWFYND